MRRVVQPNLSRGHLADRLGLLLFVSLLAVLAASLYTGVKSLPLS
jgi:hypothetical protein